MTREETINIALDQEPSGDLISREETLTAFADYVGSGMSMNDYDALWDIVVKMPAVNPKTDLLDKIRAEIEQNAYPIVHGVNNHEKGMTLYGILQVIDKYRTESEGKS